MEGRRENGVQKTDLGNYTVPDISISPTSINKSLLAVVCGCDMLRIEK